MWLLASLIRSDHPYITSALRMGGWGWKMAIFADVHSCIYTDIVSGWVRKCPKICWRNKGTVQVQALYNLPSLMGPADPANPAAAAGIQFSISALEIQLRAPLNLPNFGGQQYDVCFIRLLKFWFSEKATKIWRNLPISSFDFAK